MDNKSNFKDHNAEHTWTKDNVNYTFNSYGYRGDEPVCDGELNVLDVVQIVNHILVLELLSPMGVYISDMDGDGNITILDVIQVITLILET